MRPVPEIEARLDVVTELPSTDSKDNGDDVPIPRFPELVNVNNLAFEEEDIAKISSVPAVP